MMTAMASGTSILDPLQDAHPDKGCQHLVGLACQLLCQTLTCQVYQLSALSWILAITVTMTGALPLTPPPPLSQDTQDALHAAAEGRLRRPPKVFLAQLNTVRAASGSGRSAQDALLTFAEASAGSADVSGQQTQDAQGGNCVQSASPNAASSNAPVTGVATTTGEAVVAGTATAAANKLVLMIAESDDRVCYYPADRESVFALGSVFTS